MALWLGWSHGDSFLYVAGEQDRWILIVRTLHGSRYDTRMVTVPIQGAPGFAARTSGNRATARSGGAPLDIEPSASTVSAFNPALLWGFDLSVDHGVVAFTDHLVQEPTPPASWRTISRLTILRGHFATIPPGIVRSRAPSVAAELKLKNGMSLVLPLPQRMARAWTIRRRESSTKPMCDLKASIVDVVLDATWRVVPWRENGVVEVAGLEPDHRRGFAEANHPGDTRPRAVVDASWNTCCRA
jgi:hypothetical protein